MGADAAASNPAAAAPRRAGARDPVCGSVIVFEAGVPARPGPLGDVARALLDENREALGLARMPGELVVSREFASLSGHHLRFRQVVGGVPVEGSEVCVHVAPDGRPLLLQADVFPVGGVATEPSVSAEDAVAAARALLVEDDDGEDAAFDAKAPVLFVRPEGRGGRLVWRVDARTADASARVSVDAADGDVVAVSDLRVAAEALGRVFQPNPVYSSKDPSLRDRKDEPSLALDNLLARVTIQRLDGTHRMRGQWCDAARGTGDDYNPWDDWQLVTRGDDAFENMSAYWHVDRAQERLQALGITNANAEQQRVHPRAFPTDVSYYDIFDDEIRFGTGGVDDAEDGDVVVHEYGHSVQYDQVEGFGATLEGAAVGEGWCDFFACCLHADDAAPAPAWDPLFASWDATAYSRATPPFLRRVDRSKVYPRDLTDEPHADGEIWSRFLWDLRALVGTDDALRVVVESHFLLTSSSRFLHASNAVLAANRAVRGGRDDQAIRGLLRARKLPFTEPPAAAPPEDAFEENDDVSQASPVELGAYSDLLLADEDWFEVTVPPLRRFVARANFDPQDMDLDLELRAPDGEVVALSAGVSGQEAVVSAAGRDGATFHVRALRGEGSLAPAGYSIAFLAQDLDVLKPGMPSVRSLAPSAEEVLAVPVLPEKSGSGRKLVLRSVARRKGAVNDVRVTSPSGAVVVEFGVGTTSRGAKVVVPLTEAGLWRIELRPRGGTSGKYAVTAKLR